MGTRAKKTSVQKVPTEREESMALVKWAKMMVDTGQEPRLRLLRCGFEGLRLGMGLRMQVKRQSVSKGFPDFTLYVPKWNAPYKDPYHALLIELKRRKGGIVSQEQRDLCVLLLEQGYEVCFCKGADEAIATIKAYLGI